ncbi:MAG: hypothetical protein WD628_07215 [Thermomicrobiales bacterium]
MSLILFLPASFHVNVSGARALDIGGIMRSPTTLSSASASGIGRIS